KLAAQIQEQFKVVPTVATLSEKFLSQQELNELPGVGKSFAVFGQRDFRPFSIYAASMAEPFIKATPEAGSQTIKLLEPSRPLSDITETTTYIFRLTAVDPAHRPADSRDVLQKIEEDLRTAGAYELARADATKVLEAAKSSTLRAAAV